MKKAIVIVSFGTSYEDTRRKTLDQIKKKYTESFEDDVFEAWTSHFVRKKLEKSGEIVHDPLSITEKLLEEGYEQIFYQPSHLLDGFEYGKITRVQSKFPEAKLIFGYPLLSDQNIESVIEALEKNYQMKSKEQVILVGHGSRHPSDSRYQLFQDTLKKMGYDNVKVVTIEGGLEFEELRKELKTKNLKKVTLVPFLFVSGDHTHNDIFGEEDSYLCDLIEDGYEVEKIFKGLGELQEIQDIYLKSTKEKMNEIII